MESKQQLIERARIYDQLERASDNGIGHPSGPVGFRKQRAPPATGHAAKLRRLRKLHPELHAQVMAGELTVSRAATMAGFHAPKTKPVVERTITALQEMELWLGPCRSSAFSDDAARHRAWKENRDRLMKLFAKGGRRPQAWWAFEASFKFPGFNREKSALWETGLLGAAEARELEASWREEFDRSLAPDFTFQGLSGRDAHIAALVFFDVPAMLAELWATEVPDAA